MFRPSKQFSASLLYSLYISSVLVACADEPLFRFESGSPLSSRFFNEDQPSDSNNQPNSSLVWQPLRATFRPLNRQGPQSPQPPLPPSPPPPPPEPAALVSSEFDNSGADSSGRFAFLAASGGSTPAPQPPTSASTTTSTSSGLATNSNLDDEDQPTRQPANRFRPTKPPALDPQSHTFAATLSSGPNHLSTSNQVDNATWRMSNECFECICEASTSCNPNSRCQTSDVRHTRCGMFLISYDQWLDTNLSRELVTREALARDAAADERAFYLCVTERECAERLLTIYLQKNGRDCDKDGKIDCYDFAAIHQGGVDQCKSESLLESQYWNDFNSCYGFER